MRYHQKDFSRDLLNRIKTFEMALKDYIEGILVEYKPVFAKKDLDFNASFSKEGHDPFMPYYSSSVSIGISEKNEEMIDLHTITIWECNRYILGIPTSKNIPGSKIFGDLLDEAIEEVKEELKENMNGYLRFMEEG